MNITLQQADIERAIRRYVNDIGFTGEVDTIEFTATRGEKGLIASIDLESHVADSAPPFRSVRFSDEVDTVEPTTGIKGTVEPVNMEVESTTEGETPSDEDDDEEQEAAEPRSLFKR